MVQTNFLEMKCRIEALPKIDHKRLTHNNTWKKKNLIEKMMIYILHKAQSLNYLNFKCRIVL
jgi:hypothetical protein